ncbi:uncharacterized protein BJ212DRAFT_1304380 [Suillus subaureus]|uniref:Uncharacterized protein n=1 Tax=Suillus subaureus TaxID=48587 RepID=A0A9P7DVK6_9AGAM|nr:uncharacterized protein BJ212DRAFT_1304380 [Suillus subaureus]KAG1804267.1 hypothetical protein BJ212DRAFT_1304380 [Suillus subaureus]
MGTVLDDTGSIDAGADAVVDVDASANVMRILTKKPPVVVISLVGEDISRKSSFGCLILPLSVMKLPIKILLEVHWHQAISHLKSGWLAASGMRISLQKLGGKMVLFMKGDVVIVAGAGMRAVAVVAGASASADALAVAAASASAAGVLDLFAAGTLAFAAATGQCVVHVAAAVPCSTVALGVAVEVVADFGRGVGGF